METVIQFKDAGLSAIAGDKYMSSDGVTEKEIGIYVHLFAHDKEQLNDWSRVYTEFAWRKNTGRKPTFTGRIEWSRKKGDPLTTTMKDIYWDSDIIKWRPLITSQPRINQMKNKTVRDAVIEFEGEWKYESHDAVYFRVAGDYYYFGSVVSSHSEYICTESQFNALTSLLSTNFGKSSPFMLNEWREGVKNIGVIDWSEAPEGSTHYLESRTRGHSSGFCMTEESSGYKFITTGGYAANPDNYKITPKPLQPTFTQAMADAGDCPKLGCTFLVGDEIESDSRIIEFKGEEVTVIGLSVSDSHNQVITFQHPLIGIGCGVFYAKWVKPLDTRTDKEKAVDDLADKLHKIDTDSFDSGGSFYIRLAKKMISDGVKWVGE